MINSSEIVVNYSLGIPPVIGKGISFSQQELDVTLSGTTSSILFDNPGITDLTVLLASVAETDFDQNTIRQILLEPQRPENWRVGEALAEAFLTERCNCFFPWPDSRDERKSGSSLPGADLVGFHKCDDDESFAFGEIKTSSEATYPPGAMYGPTGMKQQIEDLRDKTSIRNDLVRYLGHRSNYATWKPTYIEACKRYLRNSTDVRIYGIMVRDVIPHMDDLRARIDKLSEGCPSEMSIELLAIYLPENSISTLSDRITNTRNGGSE